MNREKSTTARTLSASHKIRRWLETPFLMRPLPSLVLVPLLLPISLVMALVAFVRRRFLFGLLRSKKYPFPIVCVGNLAMGGTGKSPIVRALVEGFLKKGFSVAIVSRGYGGAGSAIVTSANAADVISLNDENREHWNLLQPVFKSSAEDLVVAQNSNRIAALDLVESYWINLQRSMRRCVVVLDDGLQNLRTPRTCDICV